MAVLLCRVGRMRVCEWGWIFFCELRGEVHKGGGGCFFMGLGEGGLGGKGVYLQGGYYGQGTIDNGQQTTDNRLRTTDNRQRTTDNGPANEVGGVFLIVNDGNE